VFEYARACLLLLILLLSLLVLRYCIVSKNRRLVYGFLRKKSKKEHDVVAGVLGGSREGAE